MILLKVYMTGTAVIEKKWRVGGRGLTCFRLSTIYSLAGWGGREAHVSSAHPLPGPPPNSAGPFLMRKVGSITEEKLMSLLD